MKKIISLFVALAALFFTACATNPLTGKSTMAFVGNNELFPSSFAQYDEFLSENKVIEGTADARLVTDVGEHIRVAAEKWLRSTGNANYLQDYRWEYHLVDSPEVNAWCMPGGKIVVYTGILPITKTPSGLATVMGHEVAHALLNHGQQRMSAGILQELGAVGVAVVAGGASENTQQLAMSAYGVGSQLLGTLPFSRKHESEADETGLTLMAIAGYDPDESVPFWERMSALGGGTLEFLSTHPSDTTRITNLRKWIPEAKAKAAELR
jgi:predicted Zn-dependent protease